MLLVAAVGLVTVFVIAARLHPYDAEGQPLTMASHTQLGMPPCEFYVIFHKPCPSCGLTTSFSLLLHGDVVASLRANPVGTVMALFWFMLIPWCLYVVVQGRYVWIRKLEPTLLWVVGIFTILLLIRWGIVLLWG